MKKERKWNEINRGALICSFGERINGTNWGALVIPPFIFKKDQIVEFHYSIHWIKLNGTNWGALLPLFVQKIKNRTMFKLKGIEECYYLHLFKLVGPF